MNYKKYIISGVLIIILIKALETFTYLPVVKEIRIQIPLDWLLPIGLMSLAYGIFVKVKNHSPISYLNFLLCNGVAFMFTMGWMFITSPLLQIGLRGISRIIESWFGSAIQQSIVRSDISSGLVYGTYTASIYLVYVLGFVLTYRVLRSHKMAEAKNSINSV